MMDIVQKTNELKKLKESRKHGWVEITLDIINYYKSSRRCKTDIQALILLREEYDIHINYHTLTARKTYRRKKGLVLPTIIPEQKTVFGVKKEMVSINKELEIIEQNKESKNTTNISKFGGHPNYSVKEIDIVEIIRKGLEEKKTKFDEDRNKSFKEKFGIK